MGTKELEAKPASIPMGFQRVPFAKVVMGSQFFHDGMIFQKVNDFRDGKPIYSGSMAQGGTSGAVKSIPDCDPDLMVWADPESIKKGA